MTHYSPCTQTAFPRWASAFFALVLMLGSLFPTKSQATSGASLSASMPQAELALAKVQSGGNRGVPTRVYGNSVIPGGVRGSSELVSALERDKVVKAHYASFDAANAYVVHVKSARLAYVSYRMGNEIYWTKNKVRLAKGEALLTDGKSLVRARCGNRIADMPQSRVSRMEPAPEVLDTVLALPQDAVRLPNNSPGSTGRGPVLANGMSGRGENRAASMDSIRAASVQSSTPVTGPVARQPSERAGAEVEPGTLDGVTTGPTQLPPSDWSLPLGDILTVPVTLDIPMMPGPAVGMVETVLPAFPATLSDLALPSTLLVAEDARELPEPGSIALTMLALILLAVLRPRSRRK